MVVNSNTETLRRSHRPTKIWTLFVGESAPAGGTFFYKANSQVYQYLREAFGSPPNFLNWFKDGGWYLDDLVLTPVNYQTASQRKAAHKANVPNFAARLRVYAPLCVVSILLKVREPVDEAIRLAELSTPHYPVPFPGNGQQGRFRREMKEIIPRLPRSPAKL